MLMECQPASHLDKGWNLAVIATVACPPNTIHHGQVNADLVVHTQSSRCLGNAPTMQAHTHKCVSNLGVHKDDLFFSWNVALVCAGHVIARNACRCLDICIVGASVFAL